MSASDPHRAAGGVGGRLALVTSTPAELLSRWIGVEVRVRLGPVSAPEPPVARGVSTGQSGNVRIAWDGVGRFRVSEGCEVVVDPAPGAVEPLLRSFLLGPIAATLLDQRGYVVLHASTVVVGGAAAAFVGGPLWGKSTTAGALYARGHGLVADDVTAIALDGGEAWVAPSVPELRLWPDAVAALGAAVEPGPPITSPTGKRACHVARGFRPDPVRLQRIYVLADGSVEEIEPLPPQETLIDLVRHAYCVRLFSPDTAARHLRRCGALAAIVPVRRLRRPRDLGRLDRVARLVEADLDADG